MVELILSVSGYTVQQKNKDSSLEEIDLSNNLSDNEIIEQLPTPDPAKMSRNPQSKISFYALNNCVD